MSVQTPGPPWALIVVPQFEEDPIQGLEPLQQLLLAAKEGVKDVDAAVLRVKDHLKLHGG